MILPPPPPATRLYEELSLNAFPALQTQFYDGWVLLFANGYSNRANSVNLLYPSTISLQTKIAECEKRYREHRLPVVFKLTDGADPNLDPILERQGYEIVHPTYVMTMELGDKEFSFSAGDCVLTSHADEEWLDAYFTLGKYTDIVQTTTVRQIIKNVKNPIICGCIVKEGVSLACGMAVIERGYMLLLNVVVAEPHRGKGYGKEICESLLSAAKNAAAHTAYLQVMPENLKAMNLYAKLGYKKAYSYWYRKKRVSE